MGTVLIFTALLVMACRYEFRVKPIKETEKISQAQKTSGCNKLKSNKIRNIRFSFMYVITWQLSVISKSGCGCGFSACDILFVLSVLCFFPAVMWIKDQENDENCASLFGEVQASCGPVLPPVHPRQSGECAE